MRILPARRPLRDSLDDTAKAATRVVGGTQERLRRRARADGEGQHSLFLVVVVGDDAPANTELTACEARPERKLADLAMYARASGQDRSAAVSYGFVPRRGADDVVEDNHDPLRGIGKHRAVRGDRSYDVRMRRCCRRDGQHDDGDHATE